MKVLLGILFLLLLHGCQAADPTTSSSPVAPATTSTNTGVAASDRSAPGSQILNVPGLSPQAKVSIQPDGAVRVDQWEARSKDGLVEILIDGKAFATARKKEKKDDWLVDRVDGQPVAKLKFRGNDDFKVVSPGDQTLVKVKSKDYGWKVSGAQEEELYKTRVEKGHIKVKDAQGQEINKLSDDGSGLVVTWLSIESLPLEVRLAMAYLSRGSHHG